MRENGWLIPYYGVPQENRWSISYRKSSGSLSGNSGPVAYRHSLRTIVDPFPTEISSGNSRSISYRNSIREKGWLISYYGVPQENRWSISYRKSSGIVGPFPTETSYGNRWPISYSNSFRENWMIPYYRVPKTWHPSIPGQSDNIHEGLLYDARPVVTYIHV